MFIRGSVSAPQGSGLAHESGPQHACPCAARDSYEVRARAQRKGVEADLSPLVGLFEPYFAVAAAGWVKERHGYRACGRLSRAVRRPLAGLRQVTCPNPPAILLQQPGG